MKQVLQDLSKGDTYVVEAPTPMATKGSVVVRTSRTLVSVGTERMLVDFGKASYIEKARQQPEKVKMVLDKVKTDGLLTTVDAVRSKLAQPLPLGYSNVGIVNSVGAGIDGFEAGDRVVSNGPHADVVRVPKNLCAKIPDGVSDEAAAFTVVASIGLQGIRLAEPTLGEYFVVTGVGLIGLLTVQLLKAQGCNVLAIDFDDTKLELAKQFGAEICNPGNGQDPVAVGLAFSKGRGVDGVIITASTKSNDPVSQAANMCRKRGRIVLVGVVGLELNRSDFYEKELSFQVSCSYGAGRYDSEYEEKGNDYPFGFVRWTEARNFEAVLDLMASGSIDVEPLITHRFKFENATDAYDVLSSDKSALGILLKYDVASAKPLEDLVELNSVKKFDVKKPVLGLIGAGNYASRVLIPAFKAADAQLHTIATSTGTSAVVHGNKNEFSNATTNLDNVFENKEINTVVIATQHNTHASFSCQALANGKNVFVEKPLAIDADELEEIERAYYQQPQENAVRLMVGFNRRFAPHIVKMKQLLATVNEPKSFIMTMNAGKIPADHWTQDIAVGGGRIIGEACHYIDLMRHLAGKKITSVQARCMGRAAGVDISEDKASITLGFEDGSFGTIHYLANGAAGFPKERIEVFAAGKVLQLDNFRSLKGYGWKGFKKMSQWRQDKGQNECVRQFLASIESGGEAPIPAEELFEVAKVSIEVATVLREQVG